MTEIIVGRIHDRGFDKQLAQGMFCLRHEIFHQRLGWEVESHDGMERDRYDGLDPTYMVAYEDDRRVSGCWRLLPTTGPYMLRDTFPQLLQGEAPPSDPAIWELSRFAVRAGQESACAQASLNGITFAMLRAAYEFAVLNRIRSYVTVTSVALERLMLRAGIPLRRFADRKARRVGRVLTVACWIDIDDRLQQALCQPAGRAAAGRKLREVA